MNKIGKESMKVLSYLQTWLLDNQEKRDYLGLIFNLSNIEITNNYYQDWANLLSQPFKPQMIPELFEGWEMNMNERNFIQFVNNDILITYRKLNNSYAIHNIEFETKPRTLDDFINDCQRTGIKLTWKVKVC